jgi:hypothetical protein
MQQGSILQIVNEFIYSENLDKPGVKRGRRVRLTTLPPSVSRLSRRCGSLDLLHPYGPSRPVTGIALLFYFTAESPFIFWVILAVL